MFALEQAMMARGEGGGAAEVQFYSFLSSALDGAGWSTPRSGLFTTGKETWYPLYRRLGGLQGQCGRARKISPPNRDSIPGP